MDEHARLHVTLEEGALPFDRAEAEAAIKAFWLKAQYLDKVGQLSLDNLDAETQEVWENTVPRLWQDVDEEAVGDTISVYQRSMDRDTDILRGIFALLLPIEEIVERGEDGKMNKNGQIILAILGAVYRLGWEAAQNATVAPHD